MATKKTTIAAEIKVDTGGAEKEVKDLKDDIEGVGEATAKSIKELKELKNKLKEAAVGSKEFKELKQAIDDTEEAINAAKLGAGNFADIVGDLPGPIGEIGSQVSTLTGGLKQFSQVKFSDIKGSFKELFNDLKDIGANIAKTTGLTKVYQVVNNAASKSLQFFGVSAQGATAASKAFGVAITGLLAASGLILLTATIQAVSEAWEYYSTSAERAEEAQKKLNDALLKGAQVALDAESKSIKRSGELLLAQAKARGASAEEIYKIEENNRKLLLQSQERYYNELKNKDSDEARAAISAIKDTNNELLVSEFNFQDQKNKLKTEAAKKAAEKAAAEALKAQEKEQAELLKSYEDYVKRRQFFLKNQEGLRKAEIKANEQLDIEDADKKRNEEAEKNSIWQSKALESIKLNGAQILAIDQANSDARKKLTQEERDMRVNAALDIADASLALGSIIGEQTKAGKALGVASALINTYVGASEVIRAKSVLPEPFGTIQKIASVAGIIATGIKSVKSIMSVQVPNVRGASGGGGGMPSIPSMNLSAPLMAQASTTTLNQAQINQIGNVAARAYVVESDVSGNQERITRLNRAARIN